MKNILIAGVAALSMALTPVAAQAQSHDDNSFQHEDLATAIFALVALGVIGKALANNSNDHAPDPVVTDRSRIGDNPGGLTYDRDVQWWHDRADRDRGRIGDRHRDRDNRVVSTHPRTVPARCLREIRTRHGDQRIFGRNCLRNNYAQFNRLPARCEVSIAALNGIRRGFDPGCLRANGFTRH